MTDDQPLCRACGVRFSSLSWCHCQTCHETFGGETSFDAHRVDGSCRAPAESGLVESASKRTQDGKAVWIQIYGPRPKRGVSQGS